MTQTKLYAWTQRQLDAVAVKLSDPWELWLRDWGLQAAGSLSCRVAQSDDAKMRWLAAARHAQRCAWLAGGAQEALAAALFGMRHSPQAEAGAIVAAQALAELRSVIAAVLELDPAQAPGPVEHPPTGAWSGSVVLELPLAGQPLHALLNAACVAALVPVATPAPSRHGTGAAGLVALESAVAGQVLRLRVELGACELDIGTLQGLQLGDVLPLLHSLDTPARVLGAGDQHVCDAYLGKQGSRKAAELTRTKHWKEETV
jgi:hypothetical protein